MPVQSPELTALEMPHIKATLPTNIAELDNIKLQVGTTRKSLDVDTLFHVSHVSLQQEEQTHWHLIMTITLCTFLLIIYFSFHFKLHHFIFRCFSKNTPPKSDISSPSPSNFPTSEYTKATTEMDVHKGSVTFTGYPLHQMN
jgi:hypothetical protein